MKFILKHLHTHTHTMLGHWVSILKENLLKCFAGFLAGSLHCELCTEDVTQLCSISISTSRDFLLVIVVIRGGQKCPKYQFRDIHLFSRMHLNRNATPTIPNTDQVLFTVDTSPNTHIHNVHCMYTSISTQNVLMYK